MLNDECGIMNDEGGMMNYKTLKQLNSGDVGPNCIRPFEWHLAIRITYSHPIKCQMEFRNAEIGMMNAEFYLIIHKS
jgi:hypothetical protein